MNRADLKRVARENLKGKQQSAILASLVYTVLLIILGCSVLGVLLLSSLLVICTYNVFLKGRNSEAYDLNDFMEPLESNISNRLLVSVIKNIYIFLWKLLLIIPGIVKSYSYAMADFLSLKNPEWDYDRCISQSRIIMDGHKFELFVLDLSFLGWDILSALTLGILGVIYVTPYKMATKVEYFDQLYSLTSNQEETLNQEEISNQEEDQ